MLRGHAVSDVRVFSVGSDGMVLPEVSVGNTIKIVAENMPITIFNRGGEKFLELGLGEVATFEGVQERHPQTNVAEWPRWKLVDRRLSPEHDGFAKRVREKVRALWGLRDGQQGS